MSVSASAENLTTASTDARSCDGGSMCLELALEGERLCKAGDCRAGVAFFQAAIQAGTDDLRTLSAIYSQLGNAYFYLGDYAKAMQYHKHDLTLARTMDDQLGEAKASGNLGNTLKVMGKFCEAIQCCKRHLELARALGDRLSEGRALYNLANVHHAHGKHLARTASSPAASTPAPALPSAPADPGRLAQDVRDELLQAVAYYEENLELMRALEDLGGMGRACGNLGNTCYLLGEFPRAIRYHTERLRIARAAADKPAERRANTNLANSHIFLGQFENAADHYKRTLALAEELGDAAVEAQACYSLGNTYTLMREYRAAEQYHARHLAAARSLRDRVGEGRACWSLGNAHAALGNHEKALYYAKEHLLISKELGDVLGTATAHMNISDLRGVLGLPAEDVPAAPAALAAAPQAQFNALRVRRQSMEQLSLIQITPDAKRGRDSPGAGEADAGAESAQDSFLELLSRCQSARLDSQRASLAATAASTAASAAAGKENRPRLLRSASDNKHDRNSAPASSSGASLPGTAAGHTTSIKPEYDFIDLLTKIQGSRIDDQRTELPPRAPPAPPAAAPRPSAAAASEKDAFFDSLFTLQSSRMDDQRATIPLQERSRANKPTSGAGAGAPGRSANK